MLFEISEHYTTMQSASVLASQLLKERAPFFFQSRFKNPDMVNCKLFAYAVLEEWAKTSRPTANSSELLEAMKMSNPGAEPFFREALTDGKELQVCSSL